MILVIYQNLHQKTKFEVKVTVALEVQLKAHIQQGIIDKEKMSLS